MWTWEADLMNRFVSLRHQSYFTDIFGGFGVAFCFAFNPVSKYAHISGIIFNTSSWWLAQKHLAFSSKCFAHRIFCFVRVSEYRRCFKFNWNINFGNCWLFPLMTFVWFRLLISNHTRQLYTQFQLNNNESLLTTMFLPQLTTYLTSKNTFAIRTKFI